MNPVIHPYLEQNMTDNPNQVNVTTENINTMKLKNVERKHLFFVQT